MPKIPSEYDVGANDELTVEDLARVMEDMYRQLALAINRKPDIIQRTVAGQTSDTFLSNGDINIKDDGVNPLLVEMLTRHDTATTVTWTQLSP